MTEINWDESILTLKSHPTSNDIDCIIKQFLKAKTSGSTSNVISFKLISTLLNYTIPETYQLLDRPTQLHIIQSLQCLTGLGNLLGKIQQVKETEAVKPYLDILSDLFDDNLVLKLIKSCKPVEVKEVDKLIFKGKCLSIVNEISMNGISIENRAFESSINYVEYLNKSMLKLYENDVELLTINVYINSVSSYSDNLGIFFDLMFTQENWPRFVRSFNTMKKFQRREIVIKLFTGYLDKNLTTNKLNALFNLLEFTFEYFDANNLEKILTLMNRTMNVLVCMILSRYPERKLNELILNLLSTWSDENLMKTEAISRQQNRTHFLIQLLSQKRNSVFLDEIMRNQIFLDAISSRLHSFSDSVKSLALVLADKVCDFNGKDRIFKVNDTSFDEPIINKNTITDQQCWSIINTPTVEEPQEILEKVTNKITNLNVADSDDESDGDDGTIPIKKKVPKPLYIKDLLEYLTVDPKQPQAYEMQRSALTTGPTLLRQKYNFGNEVKFYSEDLATQLVGLTNRYEKNDFESLKLNCLIAVIVSNPDVTFHMFKLLLTGDYSLQERMIILSATSLAARELRGFKDEAVRKSFAETNFATKTLPGNAHRKYLELSASNEIHRTIQSDLMLAPSQEAQDKLNGGKVIRISQKLTKKRPQIDSLKISNFNKIIGTNFFFPLVNVWYESGEIDIGHYSTIFIAHYIKTLSLLLHSAYPTAVNLNDMIKEYFLLIIPLVGKVRLDELQLIEAIVTGVLLICDILDGQYFIINYQDEVLLLNNWLAVSWEGIIDDKVKSLCAGLLLQLSKLTDSFERTMMDQVNSLY